MVGRIILTIVVLILGFVSIQVIEQKVAPDHASDLVIDQVKNETSGAQIRVEQNTQNWYHPITLLIMFIFMVWIWTEPLEKLYVKYTKPPKKELETK